MIKGLIRLGVWLIVIFGTFEALEFQDRPYPLKRFQVYVSPVLITGITMTLLGIWA